MAQTADSRHPRDRFITIYGRNPVLEALAEEGLAYDKLLLARSAKGEAAEEILAAARARGVAVVRCDAHEVSRVSRHPNQDQGVVLDVLAPRQSSVEHFTAGLGATARCRLLALDGLTTPANVGMAIRSAVAAGLDGVVLPRRGTSDVNPLVIKASAGTIFKARLIRADDIGHALRRLQEAQFTCLGLTMGAADDLFSVALPERAVFVIGAETEGLSREALALLDGQVAIPMAAGIDSLNAAVTAALVAFEVKRRG
jgi:23S rRNA (guanosine2251-2'-O)-methyltransferase